MAAYEMNLRDYWRVVRKRWWVILLSTIAVAAGAYLMTPVPKPQFKAQGRVRVVQSSDLAGLLVQTYSYSQGDTIATQTKIVTSQPILAEAVRQLRELDSSLKPDALRGMVAAERVEYTDIIEISGTWDTPEKAIRLVNTVVDTYIRVANDNRNKQLSQAKAFIEKQIQEYEHRLQQAQDELKAYKLANAEIMGLDIGDLSNIKQDSENAAAQLRSLRSQAAELDRWPQSSDALAVAVPASLKDDYLEALNKEFLSQLGQYNALQAQRSELLRYYTPNNPKVVEVEGKVQAARARLVELKAQLVEEYRATASGLERQLAQLNRREEMLSKVPETDKQIATYDQNIKDVQETYSMLKRRLEEARIRETERIEEVSLVEHALSAEPNFQSDKMQKTVLGLVAGLMFGLVFAFVQETMDTSIGTIEDVENYLGTTVLGVIPPIETQDVKEKIEHIAPGVYEGEERDYFSMLATHFDPKAVSSEAYRALRANIEFIRSRKEGKCFLISSSSLQEGKSVTSTNLAVIMCQLGRKTLLIDADLRRPSIHKYFGLDKEPGLSDALLGLASWREVVRTTDDLILGRMGLKVVNATPGLEHLSILTSGRPIQNPAELINSKEMSEFIEEVKNHYDFILFDTPPILPVIDASIISSKVDGAIIVYQIRRVGRNVLKRAKSSLETAAADIWGVVLNDITSQIALEPRDHYYYSYHYVYGDAEKYPQTFAGRMKKRVTDLWKRDSKKKKKTPSSRTPSPSARETGPAPVTPPEWDDLMNLTDQEGGKGKRT